MSKSDLDTDTSNFSDQVDFFINTQKLFGVDFK